MKTKKEKREGAQSKERAELKLGYWVRPQWALRKYKRKGIGDIQFVYITGIAAEDRENIDSPPQIPHLHC